MIAALGLLLAAPSFGAPDTPGAIGTELRDRASEPPAPESAASATATPDKSYVIPALQIIGFDFLLNRYNRRFSGTSDYDVSRASIRRNLRGPWVEDNDPFDINQFAHPYQARCTTGPPARAA
ncbi:hypothetical protein [Methylibium sp. T29-B]|uniref:hypothetical protein n=1 Tax=Methylibium sp. T29-B TaxID=1437443 RepID=UPI0004AE0C39|nr:hypothetical protein [Methylibium sp. T29-B]